MKIGILTGGGDCPGLNAVIRAVVRKAHTIKYETVGFINGWKGVIDGEVVPLDLKAVSGILPKGGTILGTSRTNPYKNPEDVKKAKENFKKLKLNSLVAIGGEDTLGVANKLSKEGLNIVGIPKTIDNDLAGTDYTFGFDTAVNVAMECIDRLHSTAESHHRIIVVEVMGRHAGWIATVAGIAGGADVILIPEIPINLDEVCDALKKRKERGKAFSIVVVAEGAQLKKDENITRDQSIDEFGHVKLGGIAEFLSREINKRTNFDTRVSVLGHIQRGGSPTAFDRMLGTRFGVKAVELIEGKKFGHMVSLTGTKIIAVPLERALAKTKTVHMNLYEIAKIFSG